MLRGVALAIGVLAAAPAVAGEMSAEEARHFVIGKMFSYSCFEGTRGAGRVFADGSVVGTVQFQGNGPVRRAFLPAGTLKVKGPSVCASMRGMFFEPCFYLERTAANSFRGTVSGLGFAYCDFTRHGGRPQIASDEQPLSLEAKPHVAHRHVRPITLRPALTANAN